MHSPWKMWVSGTLVLIVSFGLFHWVGNRPIALASTSATGMPIDWQSNTSPRAVAYNPDTPTIIGGEDAPVGAWPWMVALVYADNTNAEQGQFCGGSLIQAGWVLTAAHCTYELGGRPRDAAEIDIVIGRHLLNAGGGTRVHVQQIIRHDGYTESSFNNDLALLKLVTPVNDIPIALLTSAQHTLESHGRPAMVIGWGVTEQGSASDLLRQVAVPLVDLRTCRQSYGIFNEKISDNMICAGSKSGGIDSCQGDSGGPLMVLDETTDQWVQVGIVSWGDGCAEPNYYGVYTRVSTYSTWIHTHIPILTTPTAIPTATPNAKPTATAFSSSTPTAVATATPTAATIATNRPTLTSTLISTTMPTPTSTFVPTAPPTDSINNTPTTTPPTLATVEPATKPTPLPTQAAVTIYLPFVSKINSFGVNSGSFEAASSSNWQEFSLQGRTLVQQNGTTGMAALSGSRFVRLGGIRREVAYVFQVVTIPTNAPILEYWVIIESPDDCGYDFGGIVLDDHVIDKFDLCQASTTTAWQRRRVDLQRYAGATVTLEVRAETDRFLDSTLYVDDVTLVAVDAAVSAATVNGERIAQPLDQPVQRQAADGRVWIAPER